MPRTSAHTSTARRFRRLPLVTLVALSVGTGSLASAPGAMAQPKGPATTAPITCDGFPVGTTKVTKTTIFSRTGPLTVEKWEVCGGDGKWAPTTPVQ
ncbi:MAG TPA: hypothetical protein VGG08_08450 [Solirubrobacteraceae bacterium]|jgi:hypothetical protein